MSQHADADALKLKATTIVEEKYSDNVFFDSDDRLDDLITHFSPGLQGGCQTETTELLLGGRVDYYDYQEHDDLDAMDRFYDGRFTRRWDSRFTTNLTASYLEDETRERELAETGLLFSDDRRQRKTYGLDGQYQVNERSAVSFFYGFQTEDFADELNYDLSIHTIQILITSGVSPVPERCIGRMQLVGGLYEYLRNYVAVDPFLGVYNTEVDDEQSIDYYSTSLGFEYEWTERLHLTFDLGGRFTKIEKTLKQAVESNPLGLEVPPDKEESESWGYVAMLDMVYKGEKGRFNIMASHDLVPASGQEGTTERTTIKLNGSKRLTDQWSFSWAARGYLNRSDGTEVTTDEDELTIQLHAGLKYIFDPQWTLGAYWLTSWIDDRETDEERTQNKITLRLQWNWPILE